MNFFPNQPNFNGQPNNSYQPNFNGMDNFMIGNDLFYRIGEIENRIKKLEQRIMRLENDKNNNYNYTEPDNSLYMI